MAFSELCRLSSFGEDHIQVIEIHLPQLAIGGNLCIFCTGCRGANSPVA